jgi:RHS repeat-associated protein
VQAALESFGRSMFASQVTDSSITDQQFVTNLYEGFLQRGPDAAGLTFWSSGSKQWALDGMATSIAFRELAATLYRESFWLVSDHLGTPRMVVDKTGSLAGVKRHDYLPFGEEIYAGVGSRTTGQGYVGDNVRQHFTEKERDSESTLDYFGARYLASTQARFTSADPLLASGTVHNPQSWNRYSYTSNNPGRYTDPFGLWLYDNGTDQEKKKFEDGLKKAQEALKKLDPKSDEYQKLNRALKAYGAKGIDNGVTVKFGAARDGAPGDTEVGIQIDTADIKLVGGDNTTGQNTVVTIDLAKNKDAALLAETIAHEGSHVADGATLVSALPLNLNSRGADGILTSPLNLTKYRTEFQAFEVSAAVAQGLGYDSLTIGNAKYEIYNSGWEQTDRVTKRAAGIDKVLAEPKSRGGLYELTLTHQGKRLIGN